MKKVLWILGILLSRSFAEEVAFERSSEDIFLARSSKAPEVMLANNALYQKECASCHFGYQPGLLPSQSWTYIMQNLRNHYGVDAEVEDEDYQALLEYLSANASEKAMQYKRSAKITKSLQQGVLYQSITEIPYHIKKHRKIDKALISQKEVGSLARCAACHKKANEGIYSKHSVDIPNYGRWRD